MCARRNPFFDFDPSRARGPTDSPDVGEAGAPDEPRSADAGPISVSRLVSRIKLALGQAFPDRVTVVGEVSNFKRHDSGHLYFRLKDADASIDAVMFRRAAGKLRFEPADGLEVVAEGRVDVYDVRGQLQVYVERMTPKGAGALELAFRQLKEKLQGEGLFDPARKKPLPAFPRALGVITSATGAALRDIRRTLVRRWPAAEVYLLPSLVQGKAAAGQLAESVRLLDANAGRLGIDVIILGRGGGSLEDLWAFNEEAVARAVFAARTPIISGVGHEVDVTICDLAADARAATPTAAAEMAVPDRQAVADQVDTLAARLTRLIRQRLERAEADLAGICRSVVFRDPAARLRTQSQRLDELRHRLGAGERQRLSHGREALADPARRLARHNPARLHERAAATLARWTGRLAWALGARSKQAGDALVTAAGRLRSATPAHRVRLARQRVDAAARQLEAMTYRSVLNRGFSLTRSAEGAILRSTADAPPGSVVETELADGRFRSKVEGGPAETAGTEPPKPAPRRRRRRRAQDDGPLDGPTLFD